MSLVGVARLLDRLTRAACLIALAVLSAAVLAIVVLRYGFGTGFLRLQDTAAYSFAALLILSVPVTLAAGGHVRVDVLSARLGPTYLRRADLVALVAFLLPVFGLIVWAWWPDLRYAWTIREASVETGGLPGLFLLKTLLPVSAVLTMIQGCAVALAARRPA